jgi:hypothetical protein
MAYDFKAGTLSTNGLVHTLGTTTERDSGLLTIGDKSSWLTRLAQKGYTTGPTGDWKTEWLSVYQFLDYFTTGQGTCYIGGTAATGGYTAYSLTNTPLHNSTLVNIDVVFDCGNTASAGAAKHIAQTRQDCVALIGNKSDMTDMTVSYSSEEVNFGITSADSEYVAFIAGRKQIDSKVSSNSSWPSSYVTINMSADIAGIMALNSNTSSIFTPVAGVGPTKVIKNVVSLTQYFSDTESTNLLSNNINPIRQFPGIGVYLMGNKTYKNNSSLALNRLNVSVMVNYIKRELKPILQNYLFTENNSTTRAIVTTEVTNVLASLFTTTGQSISYSVKCDSENNTSSTTLVVEVFLTIPSISETITLKMINNDDGSTISTTTIS